MSKPGIVWMIGCATIVVLANLALRFCMDRTGVKLFSNGLSGVPGELIGLMREPMLYVAVACYGLAMLIWFRLIATEPLSVAYPALAATSFAGVTLAGVLILNEPVAALRLAGVAVIMLGFAMVAGA